MSYITKIIEAAGRSGIAHNGKAGGEHILVATDAQLVAFASALAGQQGEARPAPASRVTNAMVTAYLTANDAYWRDADELPPGPGRWRSGTPSEATRYSLAAALATQAAPEAPPLSSNAPDNNAPAPMALSSPAASGERDTLRALLREARQALNRADGFMTNGITLGYIRMPDADCPDPAHETPGIVRAAVCRIDAALADGGASHE